MDDVDLECPYFHIIFISHIHTHDTSIRVTLGTADGRIQFTKSGSFTFSAWSNRPNPEWYKKTHKEWIWIHWICIYDVHIYIYIFIYFMYIHIRSCCPFRLAQDTNKTQDAYYQAFTGRKVRLLTSVRCIKKTDLKSGVMHPGHLHF